MVYFTAESILDVELYCTIRYCKVLEEGPEDGLFSDEDVGAARPVADGE